MVLCPTVRQCYKQPLRRHQMFDATNLDPHVGLRISPNQERSQFGDTRVPGIISCTSTGDFERETRGVISVGCSTISSCGHRAARLNITPGSFVTVITTPFGRR